MLYYIANLCSILSYDVARLFTIGFISVFTVNKLSIKATQIFWYVDLILIIFIPIYLLYQLIFNKVNLFSIKVYKENKIAILLIIPQVFSSSYKAFLTSQYSGGSIALYSIITPFLAFIISRIFFKNENTTRKHLIALSLCILGYIITKFNKLDNCEFNFILIGYSFINAISTIGTRWVSKKRKLQEGILVENFIYAIQGLLLFYFLGGVTIQGIYFEKFDYKLLFSTPVLIVSFLSIIHHLLIIVANQREKVTSNIIAKDISKIILVFFSGFLFFRIKPSINEIIGFIIISIGIILLSKKR